MISSDIDNLRDIKAKSLNIPRFYSGAQIWLNFVIGAASSVLTALIFLPIFYRMKSTCLHEYFIYRYEILSRL